MQELRPSIHRQAEDGPALRLALRTKSKRKGKDQESYVKKLVPSHRSTLSPIALKLFQDWISESEITEKAGSKIQCHMQWYLLCSAVPFPFGDATQQADEPEPEVMSVLADERQTNCPVCGESFTQFWDSDQDQWMYRGAVLVSDTIYHQQCSAAVLSKVDNIAVPETQVETPEPTESPSLSSPTLDEDVRTSSC